MQLSVNDYKKHPLFPFADFRTNDASFLLLELFWTQVAREALGEELSQQCVSLQACERDDGEEPFYDPLMIDFWIPDMRRGAKVTLNENYESLPHCTPEMKGDQRFKCYGSYLFYGQYRGVTGPDDEIEQIVFASDLTDDAITFVQQGLRQFFIEKISLEEIDRQQKEYSKKMNFPTEKEWENYYDRIYPDE